MITRKSIFPWLFAGLLLLTCSCQKSEVPQPDKPSPQTSTDESWSAPSYSELRAATHHLAAERYLGKGFNVLERSTSDSRGFSDYAIIAPTATPWSPFGRTIEEEDLQPIITPYADPEIIQSAHQSLTDKSSMDSIHFSATAAYKGHTLTYLTKDITRRSDKSHTYSSFIYRKEKMVMYDLMEPSSLEFYLHKRFVRDLSRLPAKDLVSKYGTHVVTRYYIGPYMHLSVSASSATFSKEDIKKLEAKIWDSKLNIDYSLQRKVSENLSNIAVIYRQGGSDYTPEKSILNLGSLFQEATVSALDVKVWKDQIRGDNTFLMIAEDQHALIPIPDLISSVPLKIKYLSGIIYSVLPPRVLGINYILCKPETYTPVKHQGEYLRVALPHYADCMTMIDLGIDGADILTEGALSNTSRGTHKWDFALQADGLWTVKSRLSGLYLCTDGRLRTAEEDTQGLRYWLLNPIIPTPAGNTRKVSQLFIKPI